MSKPVPDVLTEVLRTAAHGRSGADLAQVYADHVSRSEEPQSRFTREMEVVAFEIQRRHASAVSSSTAVPPAMPRVARIEDRLMVHFAAIPQRDLPLLGAPKRKLPHWLALWTLALKADFNSDRLGALWWVLEPLLHVILITAATLFLHGGDVFDMPAFPFVVIGAVIWLTFRATFVATISGAGPLVQLLEHPSVSRFDIILARSLRGLVINMLVGAIILAICVWEGWTTLPENELKVALAFFAAAGLGFGVGLGANQAMQFYPGLRKVYIMIMRVIAMFSGLFYVSEQVPEPFVNWVLWNPVTHISQIARSGWFDTYESTDASPAYVWATLLGMLAIGLGCAVMNRRTRARTGEFA